MRLSLIGVSLAFMALSAVPVGAADTTAARTHDGKEWLKDLNLTPDQRDKLKSAREEMRPTREASMAKMKALREKAKVELLKAAPSKPVLDDLAKQMGQLHQQMAMNEQANLLKIKGILSKEQFEKLLSRDFTQGMMQHRMEKREHDAKGGAGPKGDDD